MTISINITKRIINNALSLGLPTAFGLWAGISNAQHGRHFKESVALFIITALISFVLFGIMRLKYDNVTPKERLIGLLVAGSLAVLLFIPLPW